MKKLNISLILTALLITGAMANQALFARDTANKRPNDMKQLHRILNNAVTPPVFVLNDKEDGQKVNVTFMLNDDGKVLVEKVVAPSTRLEEYVKLKLSDLTVKNLIYQHNQEYQIKIRFQNQNE